MFKKIDHVEIVTNDLEHTVDFYTNVLGFRTALIERIERSSVGVPMDLVYLELNGTSVELIHYDGGQVAAPSVGERLGYRMMALEVDDMTKAFSAAAWRPFS